MEKAQMIIEILKGQLIAASCQREPKISETLKSCMETLDELDNLVKESDSLPFGSDSKSFDIHNCINEVCDAVHARFHLYGQTAKGDGSFRWRVKQAIDKMLYSR